MSGLRDVLERAAIAGEIVRVIYHRGSQPGTVREVVPLVVRDDELVANDLAADVEKIFKLAHLELAGPDVTAPAYNPDGPAEDTRTVETALAPHIIALQALGWHVELTTDQISLHRFLKNGKPRKGYDVRMGFDEFTVDLFDDFDGRGLQRVQRPSRRPYSVSSSALRTRTFTRLSAALPLFFEEARKLAPRPHP